MNKSPKNQGEKSEARIICAALDRGFAVSVPFGNNQRYDLILDDRTKLFRVQCKTGWLSEGCICFQTASKNGFTGERRGYKEQADLFLVYSPDLQKVYRVPVEVAPTSQMMLRVEEPGARAQRALIKWAKDYEF